MKNSIIQRDNKILRQRANEVPIEEISSRKIQTIIKRMQKALDSEDDGIAIAAPQIGESLRIFVVSKKIYDIIEDERKAKKKNSAVDNLKDNISVGNVPKVAEDMVFINPEVIKTSKKKIPMEEGCLSVRWLYGKVMRSEKTLIKAYDSKGKLITVGGSGILSQVFQHETDHLNGILFIDKAKELKDIPPEKYK
jgi:peptide deformylase